jgi:hypothetical protein
MCVLLRRLAHPDRLADLAKVFRRLVSTLSRTINYMAHWLHQRYERVVHWDGECIDANVMQAYAAAVHRKGVPLPGCIGFIDGMVRPLCRPKKHQLHNGHRRKHTIKVQSVVAPDGLTIHLSRSFSGRQHDFHILRESGLLDVLQRHRGILAYRIH